MDIRKVELHTEVYMTVGIHSIRYTQDANVQRIARYKQVYFRLCYGRLLDLGLFTLYKAVRDEQSQAREDVDYVAVHTCRCSLCGVR